MRRRGSTDVGCAVLNCACVDADRNHTTARLDLGYERQMIVVGIVLEQARQFVEPGIVVVAAVEDKPVGGELAEPVEHGVGEVAALARSPRVGELVLVHVERHGDAGGQHIAQQAQPGRHVEHVGGQNHVGRRSVRQQPARLRGQFDGAALHAPLPEATGHGEQGDVVARVVGVPFGPRLVAAGVVGRDEPDIHERQYTICLTLWPSRFAPSSNSVLH